MALSQVYVASVISAFITPMEGVVIKYGSDRKGFLLGTDPSIFSLILVKRMTTVVSLERRVNRIALNLFSIPQTSYKGSMFIVHWTTWSIHPFWTKLLMFLSIIHSASLFFWVAKPSRELPGVISTKVFLKNFLVRAKPGIPKVQQVTENSVTFSFTKSRDPR